MEMIEKYRDALTKIPPPGCGCHPYLLTVSNYGAIAGLSPDRIISDIRVAIPQGQRQVGDREIWDTINKALADHNGGTFTPRPRPKPIVNDGRKTLQRIIGEAKISDEADLWEASPTRLLDEPQDDRHCCLEPYTNRPT